MFNKLVFDLKKILINFKNDFFAGINQKINDKDTKEISLLFEIF